MSRSESQDEQWMALALEQAKRAEQQGEVPVGAIVVINEEVVGRGWNQPVGTHDPSAHAEIVALRDAAQRMQNYRLPGATLYVTIEPCTMCYGALVHARVSRLVYGAPEPRAGVCQSQLKLPLETFFNHQLTVTAGVSAHACGELMKRFFARKRGATPRT